MFPTKVVEKIKTHILCSRNFVQYHGIYEVVWKDIVEMDRQQMTIEYSACAITKATNTHPEYVILTAFPLLQWLHKHTSMLHCTYIAFLLYTQLHP